MEKALTVEKEAQDNLKLIQEISRKIRFNFVELGELFYNNFNQEYYKLLGYDHFSKFVEHTGFKITFIMKLMEIHKVYVIEKGFTKKQLSIGDSGKLYRLIKYIGLIGDGRDKEQFMKIAGTRDIGVRSVVKVALDPDKEINTVDDLEQELLNAELDRSGRNERQIKVRMDLLEYLSEETVVKNISRETRVGLKDVVRIVEYLKIRLKQLTDTDEEEPVKEEAHGD